MIAWLRAARPFAHANIAPPILLGQALAYAVTERFDPWLAVVAFAFGALDHLVIVFANDYADRDADALGEGRTMFSGGSRVIVEGLISPATMRGAATVMAALLMVGSAAAGWALDRPLLPLLAAVALILLFAYSFPPARLSYRGFGEILQGLGVGLVLPLVGWYAQTGELARAPVDAFGPLVLLAFASNILTSLPDLEGDRKAGKRTWPVRRGESRARRDALVFVGIGVLLVSQVGPPLDPVWTGVTVGPPALASLLALAWLKKKTELVRFVTFAVGAITLVQLTWSTALFVSIR